eukprot:COSAG02_NODE_305_length_25176_cov_30.787455_4_plen_40_part_00
MTRDVSMGESAKKMYDVDCGSKYQIVTRHVARPAAHARH